MKRLFLTVTLLAAFTVSLFSQVLKMYYKDGKESEIIINYASEYPIIFKLDEENDLNIVFTTLDNGETQRKISDIDRIEVPTDYLTTSPSVINVPANLSQPMAMCSNVDFVVATDSKDHIELKSDNDFLHVWEGVARDGITVNSFYVDGNITGAPREGIITVKAADKTATIKVVQSDKPLITDSEYMGHHDILSHRDIIYVGPEEADIRVKVNPEFGMWPVAYSALISGKYDYDGNLSMTVKENTEEERDIMVGWKGTGKYMRQSITIRQLHKGFHTKAEQLAALKDLYDTTDGEHWEYKANWWSDKPLWEWDNLNNSLWDPYKIDRVYALYFGGRQFNGMKGMIPESFALLLDDLKEMDLSQGTLSGKVPAAITNHPRWGELGWGILDQNTFFGGGIDCEGINLRTKDHAVHLMDGTETTAYKELKKHKITCISVVSPDSDNVGLANLCLDYADKGFYFITENISSDSGDAYLAQLRDQYGYIKQRVPNFNVSYDSFFLNDLQAIGALGSHFLLDSEGNVIDYGSWDWDVGTDDSRVARIRKFLKKYLGDPTPHDPVVFPPAYESSDYSQDGNVVTLQKATVGKGIDVVFMGDGYVDVDVADPEVYEQTMRNGMECLFAVEPLKSLRDRFNVYMVKVVSKNRYTKDGKQALGYDYEKIGSYVGRTGADFSKSHTCVIQNKSNDFFISGNTDMFAEGGSLAFIEQGQASSVVLHETGGHGIGKLLDEYIYAGYEDNEIQPGAEEEFKNWIKNEYHSRGWGMNVSAESEPDKVPWSRMLADEWFKTETGIYAGAWMWPKNLWRPSENSVMNSDYSRFNAPSREAIYKIVMTQSEGSGWTYDFETFKAFDRKAMTAATKAQAGNREAQPAKTHVQPQRMPRIMEFKDGRYVPLSCPEKFINGGSNDRKARRSSGTSESPKEAKVYIKGVIYDIEEIEASHPGLPTQEAIRKVAKEARAKAVAR